MNQFTLQVECSCLLFCDGLELVLSSGNTKEFLKPTTSIMELDLSSQYSVNGSTVWMQQNHEPQKDIVGKEKVPNSYVNVTMSKSLNNVIYLEDIKKYTDARSL